MIYLTKSLTLAVIDNKNPTRIKLPTRQNTDIPLCKILSNLTLLHSMTLTKKSDSHTDIAAKKILHILFPKFQNIVSAFQMFLSRNTSILYTYICVGHPEVFELNQKQKLQASSKPMMLEVSRTKVWNPRYHPVGVLNLSSATSRNQPRISRCNSPILTQTLYYYFRIQGD
jgi:hypothetical protein